MAGKTRLTPSEFSNQINGIEFPEPLIANQIGAISAATIARMVVSRPMQLKSFMNRVGVAGTAGNTVTEVRVNGVAVPGSAITTPNTASDPSSQAVNLEVDLSAGDLVEIVVTTAPTGGTDLTAQADLVRRFS